MEAAAAEINKMRNTEADLRAQVVILLKPQPASRAAQELVTPADTYGHLELSKHVRKGSLGLPL